MLNSSSVFQFKRGDHICVFYRDAGTLLETIAPYLADGLRKGERCFCAQKADFIPRLLRALDAHGVDTQRETQRGALEIHSEDEVYFPGGKFEPQVMMEMLLHSIEDALRRGFSGFRTAGEMSWALNGRESCDQLLSYEKMVAAGYPGQPAIGICQYPVDGFPAELLQEVVAAHRMALERTMISSNHSALSMRRGDYFADIVADRFDPATVFHYVVQKHGVTDVLGWGVEASMDAAIESSDSLIDDLSHDSQPADLQIPRV